MIGIFDSGSGGLTVLKAIRDRLPSTDIVYFGDVANAPYGNKSRSEISQLTTRAVQLLLERKVTKIVSACNSTSASLAVSLFDVLGMGSAQLIEMVGPTVSYFKSSDARVLVCATPATVSSGIYQNAFSMIGREVDMCPIPDLAGHIEFGASIDTIRDSIISALSSFDTYAYDAVLLSCTHYPLVENVFAEVLENKNLVLFDPATEVAERVEREWWPLEVGNGETTFILSADSDHFRKLAESVSTGGAYTIEITS